MPPPPFRRHRRRVVPDLTDRQRAVARALATYTTRHPPTGTLLPTRRRRGATPEGRLLRAILQRLHPMPGVLALRNSVGVLTHEGRTITYGLGVGSSDLLVLLAPAGRALWLEVKAPDGRLTEAQAAFLARMRTFGCATAVVRSVPEAVAAVEAAR